MTMPKSMKPKKRVELESKDGLKIVYDKSEDPHYFLISDNGSHVWWPIREISVIEDFFEALSK